jgi:ribulose-5-phosphate 4-epimerase/fuculose-1-phosphate aldolase
MTMTDETKARQEMSEFARGLYNRGLAPGSSGNISIRLADGCFLVTPTESSLGYIGPADIAKLSADGTHLSGPKASKEVPLHLAAYESDENVGAVVHLHSSYCVAATLLPDVNGSAVFPPLTPYQVMKVGQTALIPYHRPGDAKVADAIRDVAGHYRSLLLAHHGSVVTARTLREAVFAAEELEETAKLFLLTHRLSPIQLGDGQIADLCTHFDCAIPDPSAWAS